MKVYKTRNAKVYLGDCVEVLCRLPAKSVHICVTSPPYWGLRDYGTGMWEGGKEGCNHAAWFWHRVGRRR